VYRTFARTMAVVATFYVLFFAAELAFEWWRLGMPGSEATSWVETNNAKLVDIMSPLARAYNNVLAMLIATIGLAIPLTANMHTPKLIEMFLHDRLNQVVLFTMAFLAANVLWVAYIIGPHFAPTWAIRVAVFGALFGWAILVPYFFYVVRFLDPSNILLRLQDDVEKTIVDVAAGRVVPDVGQNIVHERVHQIGTIVIKSLDRTDRGVALEGIWILKRLLDHHAARKASMPEAWFAVDKADFVGFSTDAIALVQEERLFFEHKVLMQLYLAYQHAVSKASDVVSSISNANRVAAVAAAERGDAKALGLGIRYFNNFLRESVKLKHVHSIYDVFYQYRRMAAELARVAREDGKPALALADIARYLRDYAESARSAGMNFVPSFAAFDLAAICLEAFRGDDEGADEVLDRVLALPDAVHGKPEILVVAAKIKLGAALEAACSTDAAAKVRRGLAVVPREQIEQAKGELLGAPRSFHEVTDRQVDMRWVPEESRAGVERFAASIGA
jgi:hypothetical protein